MSDPSPLAGLWEKDAPAFDLPGISLSESLTLLMAREHLQAVMPSRYRGPNEPVFPHG